MLYGVEAWTVTKVLMKTLEKKKTLMTSEPTTMIWIDVGPIIQKCFTHGENYNDSQRLKRTRHMKKKTELLLSLTSRLL